MKKRNVLHFVQMPKVEGLTTVVNKQPNKQVKEKLVYTGKLNLFINPDYTIGCNDKLD